MNVDEKMKHTHTQNHCIPQVETLWVRPISLSTARLRFFPVFFLLSISLYMCALLYSNSVLFVITAIYAMFDINVVCTRRRFLSFHRYPMLIIIVILYALIFNFERWQFFVVFRVSCGSLHTHTQKSDVVVVHLLWKCLFRTVQICRDV